MSTASLANNTDQYDLSNHVVLDVLNASPDQSEQMAKRIANCWIAFNLGVGSFVDMQCRPGINPDSWEFAITDQESNFVGSLLIDTKLNKCVWNSSQPKGFKKFANSISSLFKGKQAIEPTRSTIK